MILMVVHNFDAFDSVVGPGEAEAVLVVDANRVLAFAVTLERFQPIAGRNPQVVEFLGDVELLEFAESYFLDVGWQVRRLISFVDLLGGIASERNDHLEG
jgi:hypothetical protein